MKGFKEWFKERHPECNARVWFAVAGEMQDDALERLGDALADYVDEVTASAKEKAGE